MIFKSLKVLLVFHFPEISCCSWPALRFVAHSEYFSLLNVCVSLWRKVINFYDLIKLVVNKFSLLKVIILLSMSFGKIFFLKRHLIDFLGKQNSQGQTDVSKVFLVKLRMDKRDKFCHICTLDFMASKHTFPWECLAILAI